MLTPDYPGVNWASYIAEFNKFYPNISVEIEGITDYAQISLLRLQSGDWGDIMMFPSIDSKDLSTYFLSLGSLAEMEKQIRFPTNCAYKDVVYGVPTTGNAQGVLYNKRIFKEARITSIPKTPQEFIEALKMVKAKTNAIPLYANYFAGWTMGAWDAYIGGSATGSADFMSNTLVHSKAPFKNQEMEQVLIMFTKFCMTQFLMV